jgi:hypothetical protein
LSEALGVEPSELLLVPETPHAALMKAIRARDWEAVEAALEALGMPPRPSVRAPGDG